MAVVPREVVDNSGREVESLAMKKTETQDHVYYG